MSVAAIAVLLLNLTSPTAERAAETRVTVSMVAVEASNEERAVQEAGNGSAKRYDPALDKPTRAALADLPYNSFRRIGADSAKARFGEEVRLDIDDTYTLCVKPLSRDHNGLIRAKAWIEEQGNDEDKDKDGQKTASRKVLDTTVRAVPGDRLLLGGPNLDNGVLVVALTLAE